jgi:hypothetical protein
LISVLAHLFRYLNAFDLDALLQVLPNLHGTLHHPQAPVPSFRCQNSPPLAAIRVRHPVSIFHMTDEPRTSARQLCDIPVRCMIQQQKCEGPGMVTTTMVKTFGSVFTAPVRSGRGIVLSSARSGTTSARTAHAIIAQTIRSLPSTSVCASGSTEVPTFTIARTAASLAVL